MEVENDVFAALACLEWNMQNPYLCYDSFYLQTVTSEVQEQCWHFIFMLFRYVNSNSCQIFIIGTRKRRSWYKGNR